MNFIKNHLARVKVAFFILALLVQSSHAALTAEALDSLKQEVLSIYAATKGMQEDREETYKEIKRSLPTLGSKELTHLLNQHSSKKIPEESKRPTMERSCDQSIQIAQQNLEIISTTEERIREGDQSGLKQLFQQQLEDLPSTLENRKEKMPSIPSTVPGMMQGENPHRLRLAKKSRIDRWNEAAVMRLFSKALAPEDLSAAFAPYLSDKIFGGYFTVLKAYILDLVEFPPLPDHWQLQETKDSRPSDIRERLTKKKLLEGPLKKLEEEESQARLALEAYEKQPAPLTEEGLQEKLEAERKEAKKRAAARAKKAKQRARKKAEKLLPAADIEAAAASADLSVEEEEKEVPPSLPTPSPKGKDRAANQQRPQQEEVAIDEDADQKEIAEGMALAREECARPQQPKVQAAQLADEEEEIAPAFHLRAKLQPLMTHFWTAPKMEWRDFTRLFTSQDIGCGITPIGGSIRKFIYPASLRSQTGRRSFIVHEPHGIFSTVGSRTLSAVRRWMQEDFGWTAEMFAQ
jgi:hypothetical protein